MTITPSLIGVLATRAHVSGETWNPADKAVNVVLSNGNLTATGLSTVNSLVRGTTSHSSGKYYFEGVRDVGTTGYPFLGICNGSLSLASTTANAAAGVFAVNANNSFCYCNGANVNTGQSWSAGDVMLVAVDLTALKIWFGRNGTWFNSGNPGAGTGAIFTITSDTYFPCVNVRANTLRLTAHFNSTSWTYSAPSGFGEW